MRTPFILSKANRFDTLDLSILYRNICSVPESQS